MATITRPMSSHLPSRANRGSSSTRWSTRRCRAAWAASCMRLPCKPAYRKADITEPERGTEMANNVVFERIKNEVTGTPVVLYMKGTPVFPQCGFSAAVVQILSELGVKFKGVDVLTDPEIRQGIKEFSSWPTIPQLYVKGEFVGGCDIIREMAATGELKQLLETNGVATRAA